MKSLIQAVAVAAALALPVACFAQSAPQAPQTASQSAQQPADSNDYVQVVEIEEITYAPAADQGQPAAAPAQTNATQPAKADGYGGVVSGTSKSGAAAFNPANDVGMNSIYLHH
ncbi:hypothetical protein [Paraburkholderia solisilvae]|uniref:Lipoprotein n=1 Tax=Paraburkholderia solisilvae TaxID=624376 RepID=A0A6J5D2B4_9BURK|nr:hypothetical protein [Paraburkholderia solisilvae]CAB3747531.1 hypothetical protein LMG29739_00333 [Paraburkholderia solisilvae]